MYSDYNDLTNPGTTGGESGRAIFLIHTNPRLAPLVSAFRGPIQPGAFDHGGINSPTFPIYLFVGCGEYKTPPQASFTLIQ